jgi:signal transduction histidine kinase
VGALPHRGTSPVTQLAHLRETERWIANIRIGGVFFAVLQVLLSTGYPTGYKRDAWIVTGFFALGAAILFVLGRRELPRRRQLTLAVAALGFDTAILSAYLLVYNFESGSPIRQVLYLAVTEAAVRFGIIAPLLLTALTVPVLIEFEHLRADHADERFRGDFVSFQAGSQVIVGLIVGWLVLRLRRETELSQARATEAEELRDALGRRVDVLEAANRCARALASSLILEEAFGAFIREVRGVVPFDRIAVVLREGDRLEVLATAGAGIDDVFPPGSSRPVAGSIFESIASGRTVYRRDMADKRHPEEAALLGLGLRSRLIAPLLGGSGSVGLISFVRREPDAFNSEEVELVSLIGRLAATAVQNIRAYDAEHRTVEELRRLSALRADFVSLVSHELRSPMAAVIGAAQTLEQRWRELSPEQRAQFLALIADETSRLADLIADVLDTSRIEGGTFTYRFDDVDVGELAEEAVASASVGQDEVAVRAVVRRPLPVVRGDRVRLRQVLANLIENAVKWSSGGECVDVDVSAANGHVVVGVRDQGPGIPREEHGLIFEKFGRAKGGTGRSGTGLGLFIARSIAEAHGGTVEVRSVPGEGSTFTLVLPASRSEYASG